MKSSKNSRKIGSISKIRIKYPKNTSSITSHIEHLENEICKGLCQIKIETGELAIMQKSNDEFLGEYFKNVGVLFEEIKKLDATISCLDQKISAYKRSSKGFRVSANLTSANLINANLINDYKLDMESVEAANDYGEAVPKKHLTSRITDAELKSIYRRLVKICHPDILPDQNKPDKNKGEYFNLINRAYNQKNLVELLRLERSFSQDSTQFENLHQGADRKTVFESSRKATKRQDAEQKAANNKLTLSHKIAKLTKLQKEYELVHRELDDIKLKKFRFVNSPSYLLQQKFSWAEMCGRNLISEVIKDALDQIKHRRKVLMQMRTEYHYVTQNKKNSGELTN